MSVDKEREACARIASNYAAKMRRAAGLNRTIARGLQRNNNIHSGENRSVHEHHASLWGHFIDQANAASHIAALIRARKSP
jgi:hypothetical protein